VAEEVPLVLLRRPHVRTLLCSLAVNEKTHKKKHTHTKRLAVANRDISLLY
jgi:hypothetical protein